MANVYLAVVLGPAGFNKLLVVKALREDVLGNSEEFVHMFLDEARLSARLNHPNIVQTYEIGETDGRYFIAMEYLEGQPLRVVQRKLGAVGLPLEEEVRIIAETARGLHYAHELKGLSGEALEVVHRDVSPQNVFLTYDGQVKLLDFGIAKARDAEHLTKVGVIKGKLDYIAPEQIRGEKIDRRADVFSLGAMLWEAITGQRFAGGSKVQDVTKLHRRLTGGEPRAKDLKPDLPERLSAILERALAVDPNERTPTALVLADDLEGFLEQTGKRPSAKTLAERLSAPFAAERAKIGWLIEEQLKQAMQNTRGAAKLPSISRAELTQSGSGVRSGILDADDSALMTMTPSRGATGSGMTSAPSAAVLTEPAAPMPAPTVAGGLSRSKLLAIGGALAGAVLLAVLSSGGSDQKDPAPAKAASLPAPQDKSTQPDQAAAKPSDAQAVSTVRVHVFVSPDNASANLDGASLPKLPFSAELPRDGQLHYVEASAPGYLTKKVVVPFDRDREVSIVLDKLPLERGSDERSGETSARGAGKRREPPARANKPAGPASASPSEAAEETFAPGGALPSKRRVRTDIDTTDPYAN
jgi:serine/threonine-protein kinase